jgi:hypothetical protein
MKLLNRIRHHWRLSQIEKELTEEIDHHRTMRGDDQAMGDMDQALRDAAGVWRRPWWRLAWVDGLGRLRYAPRWFARRFWNLPDRAVSFIEALGSVAFIAVLFGWRWLTGTPLTTRGALFLSAFYILCSMLQGMAQGLAGAVLRPKVKPERVFAEDPKAVLELAKLTGYESIQPFNRYRGKWMTLAGEFEGLAESFQGDAIHVSLRIEDGRRINLRFGFDQRERLQALQPGQRIAAIGEIEHESFELGLDNCELVGVEPLRLARRLSFAV